MNHLSCSRWIGIEPTSRQANIKTRSTTKLPAEVFFAFMEQEEDTTSEIKKCKGCGFHDRVTNYGLCFECLYYYMEHWNGLIITHEDHLGHYLLMNGCTSHSIHEDMIQLIRIKYLYYYIPKIYEKWKGG